jgi:hypothetical protein
LLKEQFGGKTDATNDDNTTTSVVTTSSLFVSLPAIVIDDRIMIPHSEPTWCSIVREYITLLLNLEAATVTDDASLISDDNVSVCSSSTTDVELEIADQLDNSEYNENQYGIEQYYMEPLVREVMENYTTTSSCATANDSVDSSVTQVTTNLTRATTSSMQSLLGIPLSSHPQENICFDHSHCNQNYHPTSIPTETIQFLSDFPPDSNDDHTSCSTLSYTISTDLLQCTFLKDATVDETPFEPCSQTNVLQIPLATSKTDAFTTSATTRIIGSVSYQPGQRLVTLPISKKVMTVADITRQLMGATTHRVQYIPQQPTSTQWQNSFRGYEGIVIWKNLFGKPDTPNNGITSNVSNNDDDTWIAFGLLLLSFGILHDYTPNQKDFSKTYLCVLPLRDVYSLNSLVKWTSSKVTTTRNEHYQEDASSMVLRLSRSMDVIVDRYIANSSSIDHLFGKYEESVCQLQTVPLPIDPKLKTTTLLNLYNMIVRHAMILVLTKKRKGWIWPSALEELDRFFTKIGYNVDGKFIAVSEIRTYLLCGNDSGDPKLSDNIVKGKINRNSLWSMNTCIARGNRKISIFSNGQLNCIGGGATNLWAKQLVDDNDYYEHQRVQTDIRLLMAMSWGTTISPAVQTICVDQFDQLLQESATRYCETHVTVIQSVNPTNALDVTTIVTLPSLFSWYRNDFGIYRENVLQNIEGLLSETKLNQIRRARQLGKLKIKFESVAPNLWQCDFITTDPSISTLHDESNGLIIVDPTSDSLVVNKESVVISSTQNLKSCAMTVNNSSSIDRCQLRNVVAGTTTVMTKKEFPNENSHRAEPIKSKNYTIPPVETKGGNVSNHFVQDHSQSKNGTKKSNDIKNSDYKKDCTVSPPGDVKDYPGHLSLVKNILVDLNASYNENPEMKSNHNKNVQPVSVSGNNAQDIVADKLCQPSQRRPYNIPVSFKPGQDKPDNVGKPEYQDKVYKPISCSIAHDIETGGFPCKQPINSPVISPTEEIEFCYSQTSNSGDDNMALIQQWIGYRQPPTSSRQSSLGDSINLLLSQPPTSARQASLGDSIVLPPSGRSKLDHRSNRINTQPGTATDVKKVEYFAPHVSLNHNVTNDSLYHVNRFDESESNGQSWGCLRSDVSAITFGSDFDTLVLRGNSLPQLVPSSISPTGVELMNSHHHQFTFPNLQQQ